MNSDQAQDFVGLRTADEIIADGYDGADSAPQPETCRYCGSQLQYKAVVGGGRVLQWMKFPERCTCEQAVSFWNDYDAKQAAKKEAERLAEERKARRERAERLVGSNKMKRRFAQRTFTTWVETPENKKAYNAALEYASHFNERAREGIGLYIEGPYGTGKTHLAAAIANKLIERGIPVICKTSIAILEDVKGAFDRNEQQVLRLYKTIDLLIIDDLGKEQCTEWSQAMLYGILNERYEDLLPTCITTNFGEDDLIRQMTLPGGDNSRIRAIISRLHEINVVVSMVWDDYRGRPA